MVQIVADIHFDSGDGWLHILSDEVFEHGYDDIRVFSGAPIVYCLSHNIFSVLPPLVLFLSCLLLFLFWLLLLLLVGQPLLTLGSGGTCVFRLVCRVICHRWHDSLR